MRIAYITAGAAGMYCGTCLHDNTLAAALLRAGHEVALIPTYTPMRTDTPSVSTERIFLGAINVYLQQRWPSTAHLPRPLKWLLDRPAILDFASRRGASSADAKDLGAMTLTVLEGADGHARAELEKLVTWLRDELRPEIVHLSNSLFLGLAPMIREALGIPVVCSVQGEDLFVDQLAEPYRSRVLRLLSKHARDSAALIVSSRYYADFMSGFLDVERSLFRTTPLGIPLDGYPEPTPDPGDSDRPFRVGFFARQSPEKGLHLAVDGFLELARRVGPHRVQMAISGYVADKDRRWVDNQRAKLDRADLHHSTEYLDEPDRPGKLRFLASLDVLAVPTVYREPKGLFALEAMAAGVPVVLPRHGAFPELLEQTGGGILVEPGSASGVADALAELVEDPDRRRTLAVRAKEGVHRYHGDEAEVEATLAVYREALARPEEEP